jgi:hypothetical protein
VETAWTAYVLSQYAGGCVGGVGTTLSSPEPTPGLVFRLLPPAPNPLRGSDSQIHFTLNAPGRAVVDVFDVSGRCVRVVLDAKLPAGDGRVAWDLRDDAGHRAAAGLYFIRLRQGEHVASRKLVVLR